MDSQPGHYVHYEQNYPTARSDMTFLLMTVRFLSHSHYAEPGEKATQGTYQQGEGQ